MSVMPFPVVDSGGVPAQSCPYRQIACISEPDGHLLRWRPPSGVGCAVSGLGVGTLSHGLGYGVRAREVVTTASAPTRAERRRMSVGDPRGRPCRGSSSPPPWCFAWRRRPAARRTGTRRQYAAAVDHFDVSHGQPQPPGYWLYVQSGRLLHHLFGLGIVHSLVLVAAVASAAGAGLTAVAGDLGGWWTGVAAGAVVATCPFAWFSGSIVATYSFDLVAGPLLIILAWRARPGSWHGVGAVVALGLLAGFRQSILQTFLILALVAVAGSTRRWGRLALTVSAGVAAVAVWLVPMALTRPGGLSAWVHATRTEATGTARATSVLDHAAAGATNIGTFRRTPRWPSAPWPSCPSSAPWPSSANASAPPPTPPRPVVPAGPGGAGPRWERPWYQGRWAILGAAIVPPVAVVTLVAFARGAISSPTCRPPPSPSSCRWAHSSTGPRGAGLRLVGWLWPHSVSPSSSGSGPSGS